MYKQSFYLDGEKGNNAFAYEEGHRLFVPRVIEGELSDLRVGREVAFRDFDEHGELRECVGLAEFVKLELWGVPAVVVDNHNHVLWFWGESGLRDAMLVHVDQHKDMREAPEPLASLELEEVFRFTNEVVNVGNYIKPAMKAGLIGEVVMVTGEADLEQEVATGDVILNLDLDFFAEEMDYVDFEKAAGFIRRQAVEAKLITVATSPFFIDQKRALAVLDRLANLT